MRRHSAQHAPSRSLSARPRLWADDAPALATLGSPGPRLRPHLAFRLPENFSAQPRRVHEVPIARGVVARHLRFVSHEGPLGLSQVVLNREGPNRHLLLPAAERDVYVPVD